MIDQLISSASQQDLYEWLGLIFGVVYVILAAKEKVVCWIFGILSCSFIAYKDFTDYQLYADGGLQIFYVIVGFWGLYAWWQSASKSAPVRHSDENIVSSSTIRSLGMGPNLIAIITGLAIAWPVGLALNHWTNASYGYLDSATTVFAIFATVLLVRKYIDNWVYWVVIDAVYIYLYGRSGGVLFAVLSGIYLLIAVWGYFQWRKSAVKLLIV